jgi:hypothetical protein
MKQFTIFPVFVLASALLMLQGCGGDDKKNDNTDTAEPSTQSFSINVTNLTSQQTLSPVAVILHNDGYHAYMLGEPASTALEYLAEGGNNSFLLTEANSNDSVISAVSGEGKIKPGESKKIEIEGEGEIFKISLVSMLVNTNDGFIGRDGMDISGLSVDESKTFTARVYDSGTELNDEAAMTLPGQGGEGFNVARNDRDFIVIHPGVVSSEDGLSTSALSSLHRFDNPAVRVVVTRIE